MQTGRHAHAEVPFIQSVTWSINTSWTKCLQLTSYVLQANAQLVQNFHPRSSKSYISNRVYICQLEVQGLVRFWYVLSKISAVGTVLVNIRCRLTVVEGR
jgi:hypothetical protein